MARFDHEIQRRKMQGSGWDSHSNNYLKLNFHKTKALNGRTYVKLSITTNSILNIQNIDTLFSLVYFSKYPAR